MMNNLPINFTIKMLTVISNPIYKNKREYYLCRCVCGKEKLIRKYEILNGKTKSCGCYNSKRVVKHGMHNTKEYSSWTHMKERCNNPNHCAYANYGGRGISVCPEWDSFEQFFQDMGFAPEGTSLDRIDTNGNYDRYNCRWATNKEQSNNRRDTRLIEHNGQLVPLTKLAEQAGITANCLKLRLDYLGWPLDKALTTKSKR